MNVNYVYERNGQPPEGIGLTPNHGTQIKHRRYSDWLAMICPELRKAKKKRENLNRRWAYRSLVIPEQGKTKGVLGRFVPRNLLHLLEIFLGMLQLME